MTRSIGQVDAWTRNPANRNRHQGDGWHNLCEQFVNNAGDFGQSFNTALLAGNASGWLDPDLSTISDGSIGYWGGVWLVVDGKLTECGHVAFWFRGRWLMASDACTEKIGNGTGTIAATDYARSRPAAKWRGHTKRHGTETLAESTTFASSNISALAPEPVVIPIPKEQDMIYLIQRVVDGDKILNGLECAVGPGYFQSLSAGDLAGVARDLHIPDDKIVRGQDGKGLPAIEFMRLMSLFQIPPGFIRPDGHYILGR